MEGDVVDANPRHTPRDRHAGDKRKLAKSHGRKKLPIDNPEAHEGKTITSESIQKDTFSIYPAGR